MATVSLAKLAIGVVANTKKATKDLTGLEKTSKRLRTKFGTLESGTISLRGAMTALAGAGGIALVSKRVFDLGSSVAETGSKFATVFGESTEEVQSFIDDFGTLAGLTRSQAQEITATTGAIVQGMGFAQEASASFSTQVVELAGDLGSFNNIPVAESARAIQAALTGEREQLKRLGIVLREADVQQRALAMSAKETVGELTDQERAAASLALIQERAGVAVGDLARTQDSAANRARQLAAQFGNMKEALATALLPAFEVLLGDLTASAGGVDEFVNRLRGSGPVVAAWARVAIESFGFAFDAVQLLIQGAFNLGQSIGEVLRAAFMLLKGDVQGAREALAQAGQEFLQTGELGRELAGSFEDIQLASGEAFTAMAQGAQDARRELQAVNMTLAGAGEGGGLTAAQQRLLQMNVAFRDMSEHLRSGVIPAMGEIPDNLEPVGMGLRQVVEQGNEFRDVFVDAATQSGLSFKSFANTVIQQLQRIALKKAALKIFDFLAGGPLSSFAGLFDQGGRIPAGQVGIVGERGPELVRGPANVTGRQETAAMLGGGGGAIINLTLVTAGTGEVVDRIRYQTDRDEQKGREVRVPLRAAVVTR